MSQLSLKDDMTRFLSTTLVTDVQVEYIEKIDDPFNEVSITQTPDYAWYVQAKVNGDIHAYQVGDRHGMRRIYHVWNYALFEEER